MKKQEMFNIAVRHLLKQGKVCVEYKNGQMHCRYRGRKGTKCAIGALIPDDKYNESMEETSAFVPEIYETFGAKHFQREFVSDLQQCLHDTYYLCNSKEYLVALKRAIPVFAKNWKINVPKDVLAKLKLI